jgi:hypothetical protein
MLQKLGDHIADAHRRAAECEEAARHAPDEESRTNLDQMGKAWARVAKAYEFVASLERFLIDAHKMASPSALRNFLTFPKNPLSSPVRSNGRRGGRLTTGS